MSLGEPHNGAQSPCQACGACCATSKHWPRFTLETEAELERIPRDLVHRSLSRMESDGDRCAALHGVIGDHTACIIYDIRPHVCRACVPGDDACAIARQTWKLPPLPAGPDIGDGLLD